MYELEIRKTIIKIPSMKTVLLNYRLELFEIGFHSLRQPW